MCGILGTINKLFDEKTLSLIKHRGPDDNDIIKLLISNNELLFGHVRLSIQDLSQAGHQPMYSHCGNYLIIFNGEIYNHLDLRKKLNNIDFKGHSDTETIVNYIAKYGIESVNELNGIFGFCLLDIKLKKLYLIRDRYGIKPIYFHKNNNNFIYSSEIRPIKHLIDTSVDKTNLASLLKLRYNAAPTTLYKDINKLASGHILEYNLLNNQYNIKPYISPISINNEITFAIAIKKYAELFEQAVKRQLLADVEVGVLLSGGIDSALVAYYAQKYSDKPIKTFTIGFEDDDESDETSDARETARILGTDHYEIKISDDQFEDVFETCINIVEEPLGTTSIIPMYFLNKLVSKHVKVVLTGQGADEPLGGYTKYRGEILSNNYPKFLFNLLKPFSKLIKNESAFRAINSLGEKNTVTRFELIYALFSNDEIKKLIKVADTKSYSLIEYFYTLLDGKSKNGATAMMANDLRMSLSDDLLLYTDKISMHFSIEARVPILDNELVEYIESLPLTLKIHGKESKYIHKKFAESVLPKEIIYRKKKAFKSPTEKWFKGNKGLTYKNLLTTENSRFSEYFDIDEVSSIFDLHMQGIRNMEKQLFILISIYYWMEKINNT
jgi:asparagine synthase (glutamine-hydrolysing)